MKQIISIFLMTCLASFLCFAGEVIKANSVKWEGVFGVNEATEEIYSLVASGWMKAPRTDESAEVVANWLKEYTNAVVTIVNQRRLTRDTNSDAEWMYKYVWVHEGTNSLNLHLVRTGNWEGGVMFDWKESFPSGIDKSKIERLVSDTEYKNFRKRLIEAAEYARANKLGIYSDSKDKQ